MVEVTKGKNVTVETYDAEIKEFVGDGIVVDFVMTEDVAESDVKYSRAYVDNEEVIIASIVTATKTVTLAIAPTDEAVVVIYTPSTKNGAFSVQQNIGFRVGTRTEDIRELGNDAVTTDIVEKRGTLDMTLAQPSNHAALIKLAANSAADTWMVVAIKYKNTTPASYRIFKEAKVNELGAGIGAGGIAMEMVSFVWKPPVEIQIA